MRKTMKIFAATLAFLMAGLILVLPASAGGQNYAKTWETLAGTRRSGYVQIQASYNGSGRHVKQGYMRFIRKNGPSLDTGRLYTSSATSRTDRTIRSRTSTVWDSPIWGADYTTNFYYGFIYY